MQHHKKLQLQLQRQARSARDNSVLLDGELEPGIFRLNPHGAHFLLFILNGSSPTRK